MGLPDVVWHCMEPGRFNTRQFAWVHDVWLTHGDVLVEDWSHILHQLIQSLIIKDEGSFISYVALQWHLNCITQRRIEATRNMEASISNCKQHFTQVVHMVEFTSLIHDELMGSNATQNSNFMFELARVSFS